tara:strand:- start:17 stop:256 length:240 start_codon:yes stop_codon:yes gene_type:complete
MPKDYDYENPQHYKNNDIEVWEMMKRIWGRKSFKEFCQMNAFKYRMRMGLKPNEPAERDLKKALIYEKKAQEVSNTKKT